MKYTYKRHLLQNLFENMFEFNPIKRINVNNMLKHEFLLFDNNEMDKKSFELFMRNAYLKGKRIERYESNMNNSTMPVSLIVCIICIIYIYYIFVIFMCIVRIFKIKIKIN